MDHETLEELAGTWQVMAETEKDVPSSRREALRECADALHMLLSTAPSTKPWRHVKTGGLYELICTAADEADHKLMVVYRSLQDGAVWIRPMSEFSDGRFVREESYELSEPVQADTRIDRFG